MTALLLTRVAIAWGVAASLQLVLWGVQQRTRNAGIVDVGWALAFAPVVAVFGVMAHTPWCVWGPIAALVGAWSVRLGGYLIARGAASGAEEGRYADLRARWAPHASRAFFVFFQAQAALVGILSTAFVVPFVVTPWDGGAVRGAGIAITSIGLLGETIADAQLARFKRTAAKGSVCDVGLWSWSRHPNYFFEWCVWLGYAVFGLAFAPWGLVALGGQALIVGTILKVTGIPATEAQALRSKGDAYRAYQARVSAFVPWPPRRSRPVA